MRRNPPSALGGETLQGLTGGNAAQEARSGQNSPISEVSAGQIMPFDRLQKCGHGDDGLLIGVFQEAWRNWPGRISTRILAKGGKLVGRGPDSAVADDRAANCRGSGLLMGDMLPQPGGEWNCILVLIGG